MPQPSPPTLPCPLSTHYNSLFCSIITNCTSFSCRFTAAFAAFPSLCMKLSGNPSESKRAINEKATIQSGLYKDEAYYGSTLLLLNMHKFLISIAKNRATSLRISPGCTISVHLHPARNGPVLKGLTRSAFLHCCHWPKFSVTHTQKKASGIRA